MVGFLLGCSFSWEELLKTNGLCPRQIEEQKNVPMVTTPTPCCMRLKALWVQYRSNIPNVAAGVFQGELVVSMRPYNPEDAVKACGPGTACYLVTLHCV